MVGRGWSRDDLVAGAATTATATAGRNSKNYHYHSSYYQSA